MSRRGKIKLILLSIALAPFLAAGGYFYGETLKKDPDFCVSCHLSGGKALHQPKMDLMRANPVQSLAGVHYRLDSGALGCPDCHKGVDWRGKVEIAYIEIKNTFRYFLASFHEPKEIEYPITDALCLKCHDKLKGKAGPLSFHSFNSHNGMKQVACWQCHTVHAERSDDGRLINIKKVISQCDLCHKYAETSPMVRRTLGLDGDN